jgi:hypothetical protein
VTLHSHQALLLTQSLDLYDPHSSIKMFRKRKTTHIFICSHIIGLTHRLLSCGPAPCRGASTCRRSARSSRTAPPRLTQAPCWPGSPPAPLASSSPACEDGSACPHPAPNVPQNRSCHEKRRTPRVYVIIRDGTDMSMMQGVKSSIGDHSTHISLHA